MTEEKECKTPNFMDGLINEMHSTYFSPGEYDRSGDNIKPVKRTHYIKMNAYPSVFTDIDSDKPMNGYAKLDNKIYYDSFIEQLLSDGLGINEMFVLLNLQQFENDYYKDDECDKEGLSEDKKNSEKCQNHNKHKKYKKLTEVSGNPIIPEKKIVDAYELGKILKK
jgi:hypothetical protein